MYTWAMASSRSGFRFGRLGWGTDASTTQEKGCCTLIGVLFVQPLNFWQTGLLNHCNWRIIQPLYPWNIIHPLYRWHIIQPLYRWHVFCVVFIFRDIPRSTMAFFIRLGFGFSWGKGFRCRNTAPQPSWVKIKPHKILGAPPSSHASIELHLPPQVRSCGNNFAINNANACNTIVAYTPAENIYHYYCNISLLMDINRSGLSPEPRRRSSTLLYIVI